MPTTITSFCPGMREVVSIVAPIKAVRPKQPWLSEEAFRSIEERTRAKRLYLKAKRRQNVMVVETLPASSLSMSGLGRDLKLKEAPSWKLILPKPSLSLTLPCCALLVPRVLHLT